MRLGVWRIQAQGNAPDTCLTRFLSQGLIGVYIPPARVFGITVPGGLSRAPGPAALHLLVDYAVALLAFIVLTRLLDLLAPKFSGRSERPSAARVAAFVLTLARA